MSSSNQKERVLSQAISSAEPVVGSLTDTDNNTSSDNNSLGLFTGEKAAEEKEHLVAHTDRVSDIKNDEKLSESLICCCVVGTSEGSYTAEQLKKAATCAAHKSPTAVKNGSTPSLDVKNGKKRREQSDSEASADEPSNIFREPVRARKPIRSGPRAEGEVASNTSTPSNTNHQKGSGTSDFPLTKKQRARSPQQQASTMEKKRVTNGSVYTDVEMASAETPLPPGDLRAQQQALSHEHIDEALYSRQLYVLGHDAMQRMARSNVLICGLGGLGVEIAKNVILGGVRSVMLHDRHTTTHEDLSTQYYLNERDIGHNRAERSTPYLSELNAYVKVAWSALPQLTAEFVGNYQVVVLTQLPIDEQLHVAGYARAAGASIVVANVFGLCAQIFCDFGEQFYVLDTNGEQPLSAIVASVTQAEEGIVACLDEHRHGLEDGDYVRFTEVRGMTELNTASDPIKIKYIGPYSFSIGDTRSMTPYAGGGVVTQVKMPKKFVFEPLERAISKPLFLDMDISKFGRPQQMHLAYQALYKFMATRRVTTGRTGNAAVGAGVATDGNAIANSLPRSWNAEDAQALVDLAVEYNRSESADGVKVEKIDEDLVRMLAFTARGQLAPVMSTIGGMVAQEVMKACSQKFSPIQQWLYFDALECLPATKENWPHESDCLPRQSRYDGQIAVFGAAYQEKLAKLRVFVVGAGAIGCEVLKNFAMMGVACKDGGMLYVTDMDTIEKSNLNRQFLFRPADVSKLKSQVAAEAVKKMNGQLHITAHQNRVGPETETIYSDDFFNALDGVVNALDNVEARMYVDR